MERILNQLNIQNLLGHDEVGITKLDEYKQLISSTSAEIDEIKWKADKIPGSIVFAKQLLKDGFDSISGCEQDDEC